MNDLSQVTKEQLVSDFKVVVEDTEKLLRATASQAGDKAIELRDKLQTQLTTVKQNLMDAEAVLAKRTREITQATAQATDKYVHDNPWKAIGVATGVALLLGLLIGRK